MIELLPAIKSAFDANATLAATFPGDGANRRGYHVGRAYTGAPLPYVVMTPITDPREQVYGGAGSAMAEIQFTVYGATLDGARQAMQTFIAQWDSIALTLGAGSVHYGRRLNEPIPLDEPAGDGPDGNEIWGWTVTYQYAHT